MIYKEYMMQNLNAFAINYNYILIFIIFAQYIKYYMSCMLVWTFEKWLSIFYVQNNLIDCTCLEHNKKLDTYYESCKICLCEKCCKEHHHYVEKEKPHTFNSQDLNNFVVKINENKKTEKCIISSIDFIIRENIYKNNIPFIHFMKEILGDNAKNRNELLEKFFG